MATRHLCLVAWAILLLCSVSLSSASQSLDSLEALLPGDNALASKVSGSSIATSTSANSKPEPAKKADDSVSLSDDSHKPAAKSEDAAEKNEVADLSNEDAEEMAHGFTHEKLEHDAEEVEEKTIAKEEKRRARARKVSMEGVAAETGDAMLDNFGAKLKVPNPEDASENRKQIGREEPNLAEAPAAAPSDGTSLRAGQNPTSNSDTPFEKEIIKSRSDDRRYRRFRMKNGLDVLVVQDLTSTKSAAAMDVNVGYWADPPDISGLAHFLEHMLFLGTKRNPQEDAYSSYLATHGGASNAYTSMMNTNYYFDVAPKALFGALQNFAGFFIDPLMSESATEREVKAVESEHLKNLQNDAWRTFQLIQSFALKDHPFHKFGTGSTATLGAVPKDRLRKELLAFWKKHYIAKNLRLVVIGRHSLTTLETWVRMIFKDLPVGPDDPPYNPSPYPVQDRHNEIFPGGFLPSMVHLKSVKDTRNLLLLWTLPPQVVNYPFKNMEYVSTLLGNEGVGSLLSTLKYRGWATALSAGPDLSTGQFDLFQVDIDLTRRGMNPDAIREIIALVFRQIRLIAKTGVEYWRWYEMGTISAISFRMKNKEVAQTYAHGLASDMPKFAPRDLLMANYMYMGFDPTGIHAILDELTPQRVLVLVSSKHHDIDLPSTEHWYGTKYNLASVPADDIAYWTAARNEEPPPPPAPNLALALPLKNKFIPTSLNIKPKLGVKRHIEHPEIIMDITERHALDRGSVRVWFKQDHIFKRPRANVVCKFWSDGLYATPQDVVYASLYTKMVRDFLQELAYPAAIAGFEFSFSADVDGLDLHLSGYDSGLKSFAAEIARYLVMSYPKAAGDKSDVVGFVPNPSRFQVIKEELAQSYRNFMYNQPHMHAAYSLSLLLEEPHWHISEYMSALRDIEMIDVVSWSKNIWRDVALECLAHGNIYRKDALHVVNAITDSVSFRSNVQAVRTMSSQLQRVVQLDGAYTFWKYAPNKNDKNSAIYQYYQAGIGNFLEDTSIQLLATMMEKPAFHQLRTVEQLGYIVWSGMDQREGINGVKIIVQSPTKPASYLHKRVRHFVKKMRRTVRRFTHQQFRMYVDTLMGMKSQFPRTMAEETAKYWSEISTQQYLFNRKYLEYVALRRQNRRYFFSFVDRLFGIKRVPSMLSMQIQSQKDKNVPENEEDVLAPLIPNDKPFQDFVPRRGAQSSVARAVAASSSASSMAAGMTTKKFLDSRRKSSPPARHAADSIKYDATVRGPAVAKVVQHESHAAATVLRQSSTPKKSSSRPKRKLEAQDPMSVKPIAANQKQLDAIARKKRKEFLRKTKPKFRKPAASIKDALFGGKSKFVKASSPGKPMRSENADEDPDVGLVEIAAVARSTTEDLIEQLQCHIPEALPKDDPRCACLEKLVKVKMGDTSPCKGWEVARMTYPMRTDVLSTKSGLSGNNTAAAEAAAAALKAKSKKHHKSQAELDRERRLRERLALQAAARRLKKRVAKNKKAAEEETEDDYVKRLRRRHRHHRRHRRRHRHTKIVTIKEHDKSVEYQYLVKYKTKKVFVHQFTEFPCPKNGPRQWHAPVQLSIESMNTFKSQLCLYPKRPVGTVVITPTAVTNYKRKRAKQAEYPESQPAHAVAAKSAPKSKAKTPKL